MTEFQLPGSGRVCPLDYHYQAEDIAQYPAQPTETLYIAGGLYGNPFALDTIEKLAESDSARLVFNGDFNWFNHTAADLRRVNERVLRHDAIRGNVETELSRDEAGSGCGCGYPDTVSDQVVDWSNQIIRQLQLSIGRQTALQNALTTLPMYRRYQIGAATVSVVHGDCQSLAGWSFSRQELARPTEATTTMAAQSASDVIACTHTCEPISTLLTPKRPVAIANNGAAGMPNFDDGLYGVVTRVGTTTSTNPTLYGARVAGVHIDAIPVYYDALAFKDWFLQRWPPGTAAYHSYFDRISHGTNQSRSAAVGAGFTLT